QNMTDLAVPYTDEETPLTPLTPRFVGIDETSEKTPTIRQNIFFLDKRNDCCVVTKTDRIVKPRPADRPNDAPALVKSVSFQDVVETPRLMSDIVEVHNECYEPAEEPKKDGLFRFAVD
ncbi:hypothetical protein PMAYCL1PPCAC_16767, partial [Pristionchus mayeri]